VVIALLWIASFFFMISLVWPSHFVSQINRGEIHGGTDNFGTGPSKEVVRLSAWFQRPSGFSAKFTNTIPRSWDALAGLPWRAQGTWPVKDIFGETMMMVAVPLWMPFLACAAPSALMWDRWRRRKKAGCCPNCGYDLAGLLSQSKCPECGTLSALSSKKSD